LFFVVFAGLAALMCACKSLYSACNARMRLCCLLGFIRHASRKSILPDVTVDERGDVN
jgi:hypothetical protein